MRGATKDKERKENEMYISIHAPLAGCDEADPFTRYKHAISIYAPLAGCDPTAQIYSWSH